MRSTPLALASALTGLLWFGLLDCNATAHADDSAGRVQNIVLRAREEVARGVTYDSSYVPLSYPGGDVAPSRGVCTDVVVRALRSAGRDLQRLIHEDILRRPRAYARAVKRPDANIDHRRATPQLIYFEEHAQRLPRDVLSAESRRSFAPGDVIIWSLNNDGHAQHVGIVSDRQGPRGLPLIIHNIGPHPTEEDVLDAWQVLGHYRVKL